MKKKFCLVSLFAFVIITANAQSWLLNGNGSINAKTDFLGTIGDKPLIIKTKNIERMRITNDGRIGIGTNNPQGGYGLTINPILTGGALYINDPGSGYIALCTKSGDLGEGFRMNISSATNPYSAIRGHTDGDGFGVLAEATGSTGFGVEGYSSQTYGLWAGTGNSSTYAAYFSGNVFTSGTYNSSDEKLKQNIHDFNGAMDIINQLHPKQYNFRQDGNYKLMNLPHGEHYGLIAQDVEKILPGLVKETTFYTAKSNPTNDALKDAANVDFKALNYTELIPVMIKGMQEQQSVITQLQQQVDELKQMVQTLSGNQSSAANASTLNSNVYLLQNTPNPFNQNTTLNCYVPSSVKQAQLVVYNMNGKLLKSYTLNTGSNVVNITAGTLTSGQYIYSLLCDGKKLDSKNMIITK